MDSSPLMDYCRSIIAKTKIFTNLIVPDTGVRERLIIEELRFQAYALQTPCVTFIACLKGLHNIANSGGEQWTDLQKISKTILYECEGLLHSIDNTTFLGKVLSVDCAPKLFRFSTSRLSRPSPLPCAMWLRADLDNIKGLVGYSQAVTCLPASFTYLTRTSATSAPAADVETHLARLKSRVHQCIFTPGTFSVIGMPQEQNWYTWSDAPNRSSNLSLVRFTKLAYEIYGQEWSTADSDGNTKAEGKSGADTRHNSEVYFPAYESHDAALNTLPSNTANPTQSSNSSDPPKARNGENDLLSHYGNITVIGADPSGSGSGAPDEDSSPSTQTNGMVSSGSTKTATGSPSFDLGQQIQSLLQQQLTQDQKEKGMLQQRVLALEQRCKIAEQKAEDETNRAQDLKLEADLAKQRWDSDRKVLQGQLTHYRQEQITLEDLTKKLRNQVAQLEANCAKANDAVEDEKKVAGERIEANKNTLVRTYELMLDNQRHKIAAYADELKRLKEQMLTIQEITRTWKLEKS